MSRVAHMPAHNSRFILLLDRIKMLLFSGNMSSLKETLSTEVFLGLGLPYRLLLRSLNGFSLGNRRLQKQMSARHNCLFPPKWQSHSIC